jgi:ankyrin repeat protein
MTDRRDLIYPCIVKDDDETLKQCITASNVNSPYASNCYVLHEVCRNNAIKCLKFVLSIGADLNLPDQNGDTPLHYAAYAEVYTCASILLDFGSVVDAQNNNEETPLYDAIRCGWNFITQLLIDRGADIRIVHSIKEPIGDIPNWVHKLVETRNMCQSVCMVIIGVHKFGLASNVNGRDVFGLLGKHIWSYRMNFGPK